MPLKILAVVTINCLMRERGKSVIQYPAEAAVVSLLLMMVHFTAGSMLES